MDISYMLPDFKKMTPLSIDNSVAQLKKSKYYDPFYETKAPSKDRFKVSYDKFKNNEELFTKDYRILTYFIDVLEKNGDLKHFSNIFRINMNNFIGYRGFVRPLLSYMYNYYENYNSIKDVYSLFDRVIRRLDSKIKYEYVAKVTMKSNTINSYLNNIENEFKDIHRTEINAICEKYFIKKTDKFYFKCMISFIINNHNKTECFEISRLCINSMNLEMQQEVFKGIMENYINEGDVSKYPDRWFKEIGRILKNPYDGINTRWDKLGERYKETYRRWNNSKYLYDFFETQVGGDVVRLEFWKNYINSIYRIEYFKELNEALVMEFKNHVCVEFAERNNAFYIYYKGVYNIDKIKHKASTVSSKSERTKMLKDKTLMDTRLLHGSNWQEKFDVELKLRGYEQDRW